MSQPKLPHLIQSLTQNKLHLTYLALALGAIPLLSYTTSCYRSWLSLGAGGLPHNFFGWLINVSAHLIARSDTTVPAPYKSADLAPVYGAAGSRSYFADPSAISPRSGERPRVPGTVAPQRQVSAPANRALLRRMEGFLAAFAGENPKLFELKPSALEGPSQNALWLADGVLVPGHMKGTKGEFMHFHGEGSTHAVLSLADSARLIELGWAERHKLSGVVLPWGFVLIYAPRDDEELGVWKTIVVASARFVASATDGPAVCVPQ